MSGSGWSDDASDSDDDAEGSGDFPFEPMATPSSERPYDPLETVDLGAPEPAEFRYLLTILVYLEVVLPLLSFRYSLVVCEEKTP